MCHIFFFFFFLQATLLAHLEACKCVLELLVHWASIESYHPLLKSIASKLIIFVYNSAVVLFSKDISKYKVACVKKGRKCSEKHKSDIIKNHRKCSAHGLTACHTQKAAVGDYLTQQLNWMNGYGMFSKILLFVCGVQWAVSVILIKHTVIYFTTFIFSSSGPKDPIYVMSGNSSRKSVIPSRPQFSKCFFLSFLNRFCTLRIIRSK